MENTLYNMVEPWGLTDFGGPGGLQLRIVHIPTAQDRVATNFDLLASDRSIRTDYEGTFIVGAVDLGYASQSEQTLFSVWNGSQYADVGNRVRGVEDSIWMLKRLERGTEVQSFAGRQVGTVEAVEIIFVLVSGFVVLVENEKPIIIRLPSAVKPRACCHVLKDRGRSERTSYL
ncbi:hypothetical protein CcaCcLH18_02146 [Colletotrichum camelliae]|nr:hypothetical protein CcaCcLH18_02146 [Colletotrichum camelliae]